MTDSLSGPRPHRSDPSWLTAPASYQPGLYRYHLLTFTLYTSARTAFQSRPLTQQCLQTARLPEWYNSYCAPFTIGDTVKGTPWLQLWQKLETLFLACQSIIPHFVLAARAKIVMKATLWIIKWQALVTNRSSIEKFFSYRSPATPLSFSDGVIKGWKGREELGARERIVDYSTKAWKEQHGICKSRRLIVQDFDKQIIYTDLSIKVHFVLQPTWHDPFAVSAMGHWGRRNKASLQRRQRDVQVWGMSSLTVKNVCFLKSAFQVRLIFGTRTQSSLNIELRAHSNTIIRLYFILYLLFTCGFCECMNEW